ncbi:MAG: hypothetical protein UH081_01950 [Clostridia bacterium]|nr:hypothetical protein [Clostridia bacterium]
MVNTAARKALSKVGCSVAFQYPKHFLNLPVISFYTVREQGSLSCDNEEAFRDGTIAVDVWAKTPAECANIAVRASAALIDDGWMRIFEMDVPCGSGDVYHRTLRFIKSFDMNSQEE